MGTGQRLRIAETDQALVRELYAPLRRFAAVVGPAEIDPDDLVQEAFLNALERGSLGDLDRPGAYLRRTVFNVASNHRRRFVRRRRALVRITAREAYVPDYPSDVHELLRLNPMARAVLYLSSVEGRTFAEVAELLGCSEGSARAAASRGRRKLRRVLSEEEDCATA